MSVNLSVAAVALLGESVVASGSGPARGLAVAALLSLLQLPFQFLVFMRTDLYFVIQDLTGCRNLHEDSRAFLRHVMRRALAFGSAGHHGRPSLPIDPVASMRPGERRAVRIYSCVQAVGTILCLAALITVTLPADVAVLLRSTRQLLRSHSVFGFVDAATAISMLIGIQALWVWAKWRKRRSRVV
jgi:hypothetical protein